MQYVKQFDGFEATCEITEEKKQKIVEKLLKFYFKFDAFFGEIIMQSDDPQIEAPRFLSEIADDIIKFEVREIK